MASTSSATATTPSASCTSPTASPPPSFSIPSLQARPSPPSAPNPSTARRPPPSPRPRTLKTSPSPPPWIWPTSSTAAKFPPSPSQRCTSPVSSATTSSSSSALPSPKSAPSPRPAKPTPTSPHGNYRGPLHGLPWGAKDLLAVKGYPTTWGAGGFEHQTLDEDATVVQRLDAAGAVLIAKLTLGALAMGDKWYGGRTRNPWNPKQGSSGSSAGPASARRAGCVAFSIGSETLGSISSPIDALRRHRPPPHLRLRSPHRRHGP